LSLVCLSTVIAGLVPATYEHPCSKEIMGPRDKPGDDEVVRDEPGTETDSLARATHKRDGFTAVADDG
jgi:hypothetical protein